VEGGVNRAGFRDVFAATPFTRSLGGGSVATGLLLVAPTFGYAFGALTFGRIIRPACRTRVMGPLVIACSALSRAHSHWNRILAESA
jgi:hypothetical protein